MGKEVVERCDCCGKVVTDVMRAEVGPWKWDGRGFRKARRWRWMVNSRWLGWRLVRLADEIVCDDCWEMVGALVSNRREGVAGG